MFTPGNGDRDTANNVLVIFTDGNSNINTENTIPYAIQAREMVFYSYLLELLYNLVI